MGCARAERAAGAASAAWLVAAGLLVAALPAPPPGSPDCAMPAERRGEGGWTREVACGPASAGAPAVRGPARRLFALPLDPNRADARALETLPGIGPARAAAIVAERSRSPFASLPDLARVRGIGPRTLAGLAGLVAVEEAPRNR